MWFSDVRQDQAAVVLLQGHGLPLAQGLLHHSRHQPGIGEQGFVALPLRQQHRHHLEDHVRGGLVTREQGPDHGGDEFVVAEPAVLAVGDLGRLTEQVITRPRPLALDEIGCVGTELRLHLVHFGLGVTRQRQRRLRPARERVLVLARRAQQRADDPHGKGECHRRAEIRG